MTQQHAAGPGTGKYKPIAELGRGGMATVYLAIIHGPAGFNKLQVIKRLRPALAADPEFLQMFLEEARLAARINHPNVVQTNEVGFDGQFYFIAMEYLDGQTLESINRKARKAGKTFPLGMHLYALAETLAGLHFAHELTDFDGSRLNVVHRDVSPHNVMVGYDGHVKILDFGIAKAADSSSDTRTGIMKGKCAYMAPEQFGGGVDRRADVFAVGVMLWQALTGARLWKGQSDAEIFAHLSRGEIATPRSIKPDVPEAIERICMRALAPRPDDRFQTAADFQAELENYLATAQMRVASREVGAHLNELFADNRAAIKAAIEAQVTKGPIFDPRQATDGRTTSVDVPLLWSLVPASVSDPASSAPVSVVDPTVVSDGSEDVVRGTRRGVRLSMLALLGLAAIAVALFAAMRRTSRPNVAAADTSGASAVNSPASPAPTSALVRLTIRATPKDARLFVDDAPLEGNPASGSFLKDGAAHNIRAEAAGYVTKRELAQFDTGTLAMDIALEREKAKPAPVAAWTPPPPKKTVTVQADPPPPQPAAPPSASVPPAHLQLPATTPAKQQTPALDTSDPWSGTSPPKTPR